MAIILRHNTDLELNRAEYRYAVTTAELSAMVAFQAANSSWLACDCLNVALPGAHFDTVALSDLGGVFEMYRALFAPQQLTIFRRGAWLCQSPAAQRHISYWINGRNLRKGMSSDVRQFDTFAEACAWLVLAPELTAQLESGEGFVDLARFEIPAGVGPSAALPAASR